MIKIVAIGIGAALLAVWLKNIKSEYALWVIVAAGILMGLFGMKKLEAILEELQFLKSYLSSYGAYFKILLKVLGIAYLAEFSADLCKDAGAHTLASQIELFGKLSILLLCMPIMRALLETIDYFLGG